MVDIRNKLERSKTVPQTNRTVTRNLTIHWNGPAVSSNELAQLKGDAKYHVETRGWDGLSYHYALGRSLTRYQCRDKIARLAHSGVAQGNNESLALLCIIGEGQALGPEYFKELQRFISDLGINPRWVLGHRFWPRLTVCPGPLLTRWLFNEYYPQFTAVGSGSTIVTANLRDESSTLSHIVKTLPVGTQVAGNWVLGTPFKGDAMWLKVGSDFLHASVLNPHSIPVWGR